MPPALETATVAYAGDTVAPALGTLYLRSTVTEPADGHAGVISKARVSYELRLYTSATTWTTPFSGTADAGPNGNWAMAVSGLGVGVYEVWANVTGSYYTSGPLTQIGYVAVYDPSAGFVTGGGWINSPAGAYPAGATLTGRADFGLNAKYQSGSTVPVGQTEFQYKPGSVNFHSTSYAYLVVTGSRAQLRGAGTVNGISGYSFLVTVIDGAPDRFRMKIWNTTTGQVIYDDQPGAGDDADPTVGAAGGNIVVH